MGALRPHTPHKGWFHPLTPVCDGCWPLFPAIRACGWKNRSYGEMVLVYASEVIPKTPGKSKLSPDVLRLTSTGFAAYTLIQTVYLSLLQFVNR